MFLTVRYFPYLFNTPARGFCSFTCCPFACSQSFAGGPSFEGVAKGLTRSKFGLPPTPIPQPPAIKTTNIGNRENIIQQHRNTHPIANMDASAFEASAPDDPDPPISDVVDLMMPDDDIKYAVSQSISVTYYHMQD